MGKFLNMMSASSSQTLKNRAEQLNTQASIAQDAVVAKLESEKSEIEIKIQDLTDFAPDTTDSLRPGLRNWNPTEWANNLQKYKVRLYEINVELEIAKATQEEFFGKETADADSEVPAE